ncbi:MAG: hypothetical protein WKF30_17880, partial [Pyrinomonadaceae bacterium]
MVRTDSVAGGRRRLIIIAADEASGLRQVWQLSYPNGEARRITNDTNSYHGSSLTSDSATLVTVQTDQVSNIWTATPSEEAGRAKQITFGKNYGASGVAWAPDKSIVHASLEGGVPDIWSMKADGANQKQLTLDAGKNYLPVVSNDNRYIAFVSDRQGTYNIWRMDIDGGNQKRLTSGKFDGAPSFFPDNRRVAFFAWDSDKPTASQVSIDGDGLAPLTNFYSYLPVVSPDGKLMVYQALEDQKSFTAKLAVAAVEGGQIMKRFDLPVGPTRWTPDGLALLYIDAD